MAAALCAMMIMSGFSAYAGELGTAGGTGFGNDVITAPNSLVGTTGDVVALDDIGISITASDYISIIQSEGFVYVYTMEDGSMPYVIIGKYDAVDDNFADAFTVYMSSVYSDLDVNELHGQRLYSERYPPVLWVEWVYLYVRRQGSAGTCDECALGISGEDCFQYGSPGRR